MRVIVTGSRDWDIQYKVNLVLNELYAFADVLGQRLTLVHGHCPTGADNFADFWAIGRDPAVKVERWPADWKQYGNAAGPRRNEAMIDAGADMCIAFLKGGSTGTRQTIALARTAKIPTFVIEYEPVIAFLSPGPG